MEKLKVMTILGTRPEIIRLSEVIKALDRFFNHILTHTGQNYDYELNQIFFKDLELREPDYYLDSAGKNLGETIGNIISKSYDLLIKEKPDALLVLGDTNSALSVISAKRLKIPIFHMEAGNRCFDQRVPEEINRKIVDHVADINLTYSDIAREYLVREGFPSDRIIKTGSPMLEVINSRRKEIENSDIIERLGLEFGKYFVISTHREENIDTEVNFRDLIDSLNAITRKYNMPVVVSSHPRTRNMIDSKNIKFSPLIKIIKPLGFIDYLKLQIMSKVVISDSGTINEEASILGFKALNIRQAFERPEAMEEASVMMIGLKKERILQGLKILEKQEKNTLKLVRDYSMTNVSDKVLRIILSYTDYVNRVVWGKR